MDTESKLITGTPEKTPQNPQNLFTTHSCTRGLMRMCVCCTCQEPGLVRTALVMVHFFILFHFVREKLKKNRVLIVCNTN